MQTQDKSRSGGRNGDDGTPFGHSKFKMSVGQPHGKTHHEGCLKLAEVQRNRTTTAICKVVQFTKCISFNITYTFNKITKRLGSPDKYTQKVK